MQSGELTVTGNNSTRIPLAGWPRQVIVRFEREHEHEPVPCNPHHHDRLEYEIIGVDEDHHDHRRPGHHHHDRQYFLVIRWEVAAIREIEWIVF
jgi:hypothetical protein